MSIKHSGKCDACGTERPTALCSLDMHHVPAYPGFKVVRVCVHLCRQCQRDIDGRTVNVSRQTAEE